MKHTKNFIKRNIAGEIILVPADETAGEYNGMITLTETGEFIWDQIEKAKDFHELVTMITSEYDIDHETAARDASVFIMQLLKAGMIRPTGPNW